MRVYVRLISEADGGQGWSVYLVRPEIVRRVKHNMRHIDLRHSAQNVNARTMTHLVGVWCLRRRLFWHPALVVRAVQV